MNCGPGAEMGIYQKIIDNPFGIQFQHGTAVNFNVPMTLSLYDYRSADDIGSIFHWFPTNPQWWITGFNPNEDYNDVNKQVMIGSVDFSGREEMYEGLKEEILSDKTNKKDYIILDHNNYLVWVIWYETRLV